MTWYYKGDLRFKGDVGWTLYDEDDSDKIERAYQVFASELNPMCLIPSFEEWPKNGEA